MAISVSAFGTGGKRAKIFKDIYFSVEDVDGVGVLYTKTGEYSAILAMQNPVQKFCANIDSYYEYSSLMAAVMATLGDGYAIHKQDIFTQKSLRARQTGTESFCLKAISAILREGSIQTVPLLLLSRRKTRKADSSALITEMERVSGKD